MSFNMMVGYDIYNGAFSIVPKLNFDDQSFFARDSTVVTLYGCKCKFSSNNFMTCTAEETV
jgi:hypothetical protein